MPEAAVTTPCLTILGQPDPRLRRHVLTYSGFTTATPIPHRLLPINVPALVIDVTGACRVATGVSAAPTVGGPSRWGHGVTIGLTPGSMSALLGLPLVEITGRTVPLADVLGPGEADLAEQLAGLDWPGRFALLDRWLAGRLTPDEADPLLTAAWWRLQHGPGRARVDAVATALGTSRRRLEVAFRRSVGVSPGTVARVARFQRAASRLLTGTPAARVAADTGYADQPHLTRDVRSLAGLTPTALRDLLPAHGIRSSGRRLLADSGR
ncbi:helix-turn-helix domain-containing protein [Actinoplanes couchii]|uniref:helix-turn-helix domain-containing protein n=1 Tax=Actinoplanes couchii TaxID=403638 RepID=UPI0019415914|nr:helix-turn-helix domain-containing protein [Actinoplanes couchii]MDR6325817.1 AraC-like DNA-binding protein [Actinoplanes couchii]